MKRWHGHGRRGQLLVLLSLLACASLAGATDLLAAERGSGGGKAAKAARKSSVAAGKAKARNKRAAPSRPAATPAAASEPAASSEVAPAAGTTTAPPAEGEAARPRPGKPRVYTFGGLDLEGKLKTPQLLYFRSRMRQELDTSSPPRRSFLKELEQTADAKGL